MIQIIKNGIKKFNAYYLFQAHKHNHYEIIYIKSGQCIISIDEYEVALNLGDCIIINNEVRHKFYVNSSGCRINQLEVVSDSITMSKNYYKISNCKQVDACLDNIIIFQTENIYNNNSNILVELEAAKVLLIIESIAISQPMNIIGKHVVKLIQYIKQNDCCDIDLGEYAKNSGITDRYLRKIFEKQVGVCPKDYLTNLRMEKAKKLLSYTRKSVSEIALESGYNTIQYFSKVFKKEIGLTPKEFREYQLKLK